MFELDRYFKKGNTRVRVGKKAEMRTTRVRVGQKMANLKRVRELTDFFSITDHG